MGNLLSPGRGLLLYYPVSLLSIWGFWKLWGQTHLKAFVFASIPVLALLLYSAWFEWGAGISWGPRFLIPVLPYVTILAVWGAGFPMRIPPWLRTVLLASLIVAGWIVSLQGNLFNFLGFYASKNLPDAEIITGNYNFSWQYSPIVAGWQWGMAHGSLDIYWYQGLVQGSLRTIFIVSLIVLGLAAAAIYGWKFFRKVAETN